MQYQMLEGFILPPRAKELPQLFFLRADLSETLKEVP